MVAFNAAASCVAAAEGAVGIGGKSKVSGARSDDIPEKCITAVYSIQKLADLVRRGDDSQILFALGELPQLMEHCFHDACVLFVPAVCEHIAGWTQDLKIKAGRELLALEGHTVEKQLARAITFSCMQLIRETNDVTSTSAGKLYEIFGRLAAISIPAADWGTDDLASMLRFVDQYSESPFSTERRVASSFCLGMCMCNGSKLNVARQGFSRLWSLASDPSLDVLAKCLEVIGECAASFTDLVVVERIWPLIEKAWAQEACDVASSKSLLVRASAVKCAAQLCEARFSEDSRGRSQATAAEHESIQLLLKRLLDFARTWSQKDQRGLDDGIYVTEIAVAEHLVKLTYYASQGARKSRSHFPMKTAVAVYSQLVQANGPGIREKCAYNMPAMAYLTNREKGATAMLTTCCEALAFDTDETVRDALARGFHETVKSLSSKTNADKLKGTLINLVQDDCTTVKSSIVSHLPESLAAVASIDKGLTPDELRDALQKTCSALVARDWRLTKAFALQTGKICEHFPMLGLEDLVVPMLVDIVTNTKSSEVRTTAAKAIVTITRTIPKQAARDKYVSNFLESLVSGAHQKRITVVECALHALDVYSEELFSKLFAKPVLQLAHDDVPNVRIRVAKALPQLAPRCQGHSLFEPALTKLRNDPDPDVRYAMRSYVLQASKFVSRSKDREDVEHNRRVEELRYYSVGGPSTPRSAGRGSPSRQLTPRSFPSLAAGIGGPLLYAVQAPGRLGKRLAEIASLKSSARNSAQDDVNLQDSAPAPTDSGSAPAPPLDHQVSAMSWFSDTRSGDGSGYVPDLELSTERKVNLEKSSKPADTHGSSGKSALEFSAVLSGSILSFGTSSGTTPTQVLPEEPSAETKPLPIEGTRSGFSRGRSSGLSVIRKGSLGPKLNAQALPVQALARKIQNRRSRSILSRDGEARLAETFSSDSAFFSSHSGEAADEGDQAKAEEPPKVAPTSKATTGQAPGSSASHAAETSAAHAAGTSSSHAAAVPAAQAPQTATASAARKCFTEIPSRLVAQAPEPLAVGDEEHGRSGGECDVFRIDAPATSPLTPSTSRAFLGKLSPRIARSRDTASTFSPCETRTAHEDPATAISAQQNARPNSTGLSYYEQEEAGDNVAALRSIGKKLTAAFVSGLRGLTRRRSGTRRDVGGGARRGSPAERNAMQEAVQEERNDRALGPEDYVPHYGGASPPWMRQRKADELPLMPGQPRTKNVTAAVTRGETRSPGEPEIVPGAVASLRRQWESMEGRAQQV